MIKIIFIITLWCLPVKTVDNSYLLTLYQRVWSYEYLLHRMQSAPLKRGENKKMKQKRINRLKNKIEVYTYLQSGYKLNPKVKHYLYE